MLVSNDFKCRDNLSNFLKGCKSLGLVDAQLFDAEKFLNPDPDPASISKYKSRLRCGPSHPMPSVFTSAQNRDRIVTVSGIIEPRP